MILVAAPANDKIRQWLKEGCRKPVLGVWGRVRVHQKPSLFGDLEERIPCSRFKIPSTTDFDEVNNALNCVSETYVEAPREKGIFFSDIRSGNDENASTVAKHANVHRRRVSLIYRDGKPACIGARHVGVNSLGKPRKASLVGSVGRAWNSKARRTTDTSIPPLISSQLCSLNGYNCPLSLPYTYDSGNNPLLTELTDRFNSHESVVYNNIKPLICEN